MLEEDVFELSSVFSPTRFTYFALTKPLLPLYSIKYHSAPSLSFTTSQTPISVPLASGLNEHVGSVKVLKDGEVIYEDSLITIEDAENNDIKYLIDNIMDRWF